MEFKFYQTRSNSIKQGVQTTIFLVTEHVLMTLFGHQTFCVWLTPYEVSDNAGHENNYVPEHCRNLSSSCWRSTYASSGCFTNCNHFLLNSWKMWEIQSHNKKICSQNRVSREPRGPRSCSPMFYVIRQKPAASCFHLFGGVWNPWWSTKPEFLTSLLKRNNKKCLISDKKHVSSQMKTWWCFIWCFIWVSRFIHLTQMEVIYWLLTAWIIIEFEKFN